MEQYSDALLNAVEAELEPWIRHCVRGVLEIQGLKYLPETEDRCHDASLQALREVREELAALLEADIDRQATTPLAVLRKAVRYPTELLQELGAGPAPRDDYARAHFPADIYDLTPATFGDVGPATAEAGIAWGAAKAMAHRARHGHGAEA